jgi:hypothetical protein
MNKNRSLHTLATVRNAVAALAVVMPLLVLAVEGVLPLALRGHVIALVVFAFVGLLLLAGALSDVLFTVQRDEQRTPR